MMKMIIAATLLIGSVAFARGGSVQSDLCVVPQTNEVVSGDRFFSLASEYANRNNVCVHAKIFGQAGTGRVYSAEGRALGKGLTNSEASDVLRNAKAYGECRRHEVFSCQEYNIW